MNEDSVMVLVWKQSTTFNFGKQLETNKHLTYFESFFPFNRNSRNILNSHSFVCSTGSFFLARQLNKAATFRSYFRSLDLLQQEMGSFLDFVIPGGALGNTAAAFMAREMGLPLRRLICGVTLGRKCGGSMENEQGIEWKREFLQVLMSSYKDCNV